jgi:hypothetical protein
MDLREEFEDRVKKLENYIEEKGLGSRQLYKAKKVQRTMNTIVFLGGLLTIAGIAIWQIGKDKE